MADSSVQQDNGGSWWGSWIQVAKDKSASALDFMKKDLAEFSSTMQRDTSSAIEATSVKVKETLKPENTEAAKDKMKKGFHGFLGGLSKALTIPAEDLDSKEKAKRIDQPGAIYDRSKARLHAVQVDPGTYLNEPTGSLEDFEKWLETFELESKKGDISELLVVKVEVRALYTRLVPSELSHSEFWQRYFYRLHQLQIDEARKQALMKRAETPTEDDTLGWEDDWSGDEGVDDFEKVSSSEVKEAQPEDPSSRLLPDTQDNKESAGKDPSSRLLPDTQDDKESAGKDPSSRLLPDTQDDKESAGKDPSSRLLPDTQEDEQSAGKESGKGAGSCSESVPTVTEERVSSCLPVVEEENISTTEQPPPRVLESVTPPKADSDKFVNNHDKTVNVCDVASDVKEATVQEPEIKDYQNIPQTVPLPTQIAAPLPDTSTETKSDTPTEKVSTVGEMLTEEAAPAKVSADVNTSSPDDKAPKVGSDSKGAQSDDISIEATEDLKTKVKGDMVLVGSDRESPSSESSGNKEPSVDDDWDQDFDVELTEEDMKAAEAIAQKLGSNLDINDDDWENWE